MTQEDKQILLADLCARLPYGVKVHGIFLNYNKDKDKILYEECDKELNYKDLNRYESLKPYLRPMSSMTEEEKDEMFDICTLSNCSVNSNWEFVGVEIMSSHPRYGDYYSTDYKVIDWFNKNMFDYRGLISKRSRYCRYRRK